HTRCLSDWSSDVCSSDLVRTPQGPMSASRYLLTAGAWSEGLLNEIGWKPGIRPVRGQIALLNPGPNLLARIVEVGKRYLVPRLRSEERRVGKEGRARWRS